MTLKHLSSCVDWFDLALSGTERCGRSRYRLNLFGLMRSIMTELNMVDCVWIWLDWYGITGMKVVVYGTGSSYGQSLDWFVKQSFSLSKSVKKPKNWFYIARARRASLFYFECKSSMKQVLFIFTRARRASAIRLQRINQEERVGFIYMRFQGGPKSNGRSTFKWTR